MTDGFEDHCRGITRRRLVRGIAVNAALGCVTLPRVARAQTYPNRPVRFIIPFAAGGVADVTARLTAEKLGDKIGQRLVIENMPGPGGIAAGRVIATAAPDGHTLGLLTNGTAISVALYKSLPFDPVKAFGAISALGNFDLIFATNADSQFRTLADFLRAARAQTRKAQCRNDRRRQHAEFRCRIVEVASRHRCANRALSHDTRCRHRASAQ